MSSLHRGDSVAGVSVGSTRPLDFAYRFTPMSWNRLSDGKKVTGPNCSSENIKLKNGDSIEGVSLRLIKSQLKWLRWFHTSRAKKTSERIKRDDLGAGDQSWAGID